MSDIPNIPTYADLLARIKELEAKVNTLDKMKEEVVSLMEDYFDQLIEERMDVIGQNGNDGTHYEPEFGKLGEIWDDEDISYESNYVDYGAGPRKVQHMVNEKEYWAKLKELPDDE